MIAGALVTAYIGPAFASRISIERLEFVILVLLLSIGAALIIESFLPVATAALVPASLWPVTAFALGLAIGLVSSLLGVAGGELIIPSFVFAFGAPITIAGSASLVVSLPTVAVGVVRYVRRGGYGDRAALRET
ncbi:MAG: sulfite exporter TauE/SafE family protein, partial [Chloroflexi bacterium]|nr:sulfite exporter TauE/SafE family protein [Chloroflexota bacterium]